MSALDGRLHAPSLQVDYVGYSFSGSCEDFALVRLALPAPAGAAAANASAGGGAARAAFALAYMRASCLGYDPKLNKCPGSAAVAAQGPFSCKIHDECCSGRCNCPPAVGGATGTEPFDVQVLGAKLPSGAPLSQRIRPADYGASLLRKACCTA